MGCGVWDFCLCLPTAKFVFESRTGDFLPYLAAVTSDLIEMR